MSAGDRCDPADSEACRPSGESDGPILDHDGARQALRHSARRGHARGAELALAYVTIDWYIPGMASKALEDTMRRGGVLPGGGEGEVGQSTAPPTPHPPGGAQRAALGGVRRICPRSRARREG